MTTLYLVRHGETVANAAQILQGWQGGELNETGKAQARDVAEKMKDAKIDAFVASDLHRAIQTCSIIASARGLKPVSVIGDRSRASLFPTLKTWNGPMTWRALNT